MEEKDTSCCPVALVSRTGLPIQTLADFIELRLSWAKVDLQLFGVLSSAVGGDVKIEHTLKNQYRTNVRSTSLG